MAASQVAFYFRVIPHKALHRTEIKTFIHHLHTHRHVYSYATFYIWSSVLSVLLLCMFQLLSHGAAGTWLLTDNDATARDKRHLIWEITLKFEMWYSNRSSYGNSDFITTLHKNPKHPKNLHYCYLFLKIWSAYGFVHHDSKLNMWGYMLSASCCCLLSVVLC